MYKKQTKWMVKSKNQKVAYCNRSLCISNISSLGGMHQVLCSYGYSNQCRVNCGADIILLKTLHISCRNVRYPYMYVHTIKTNIITTSMIAKIVKKSKDSKRGVLKHNLRELKEDEEKKIKY